ncbi:MAG: tRNA ((37)-N6)-threonylcarbamoyltransferase complex dimerization subunit type 1 TsaB [Pseudomonadota bacterium]
MAAMPAPTHNAQLPSAQRLLAMETSTDTLSLALGSAAPSEPLWSFDGPGGQQASATLLPALRQGLTQVDWPLSSLDAIVVGRGPGSFTGLRTACSVAQGLAYGSPSALHPEGLPVLPVDTLLAVAEEARAQRAAQGHAVRWVATVLDARMDELYVALYEHQDGAWHAHGPARLCAPQDVAAWALTHAVLDVPAWQAGQWLWAGNVWAEDSPYASRLGALLGTRCTALPTAAALLRLAPAQLALGLAVRPHNVLPLYVRDKVALTTAEREAGQRLQPLSAAARDAWPLRWASMQEADLDAVLELEKRAHSHPWSRQHFVDSLRSAHPAWLLWAQAPERDEPSLLGYWVAMPGVDEAHLLNITVAPEHQRQGWGRFMLEALCVWARQHAAQRVWLEVRHSNHAARTTYERSGFVSVGVRKGYYPAGRTAREDAVVMNRPLNATA